MCILVQGSTTKCLAAVASCRAQSISHSKGEGSARYHECMASWSTCSSNPCCFKARHCCRWFELRIFAEYEGEGVCCFKAFIEDLVTLPLPKRWADSPHKKWNVRDFFCILRKEKLVFFVSPWESTCQISFQIKFIKSNRSVEKNGRFRWCLEWCHRSDW